MLQFFHDPHYDFLGKRRLAYAFSGLLVAASLVSLAARGLSYGVDFRGGTEIRLKLRDAADVAGLRARLEVAGIADVSLQRYGKEEEREVLVRVGGGGEETAEAPGAASGGRVLEDTSRRVLQALEDPQAASDRAAGRIDLNQASRGEIAGWLVARTPAPGEPEAMRALGSAIADLRNQRGGILSDFEALGGLAGMTPEILQALRSGATLGGFALRSVDFVGPSVGQELRQKAILAIIGSLIGILAYLAFRFEAKYGVSAVVTVAHDALVTVGLFSILQRPFDLTVVAAVLTIVGYSLNDTIVIFDRVRENLRLKRSPSSLETLMNDSVNETLSRSILTSLTVLLVVVSLYLFGGDRINDFAFAMLVGVIIGSYSTIYISCPFVLLWEDFKARRHRRAAAASR